MSERQQSGYVVEGKLPQAEDPNKKYISQIIDYVELIIKHVPFLVEGEELRGECQEAYEKVLKLFRQIEEEYNRLPDYIDIDFDIEEVKESLRSIFNGTYEKFIRENLSVVFPEKLAEVNIPEFCQAEDEEYTIPDVRRWQHANKIISPELADSEYMDFIAKARGAVTNRLTKDGAFGLPDDFIITRPEYIPGNDDKMKLSDLLKSFECRKLKEIEDEDCNGINPEDDLKFANSVLKFIKSIKLPSEKELAKQYKEATIKENSPAVRDLAESMAKEYLKVVLDDALIMLSEKLNGYEGAPKLAAGSLNKARKRKRQPRQDNCEVSEQDVQATEVNLKVGGYIKLSHETFPWLDDKMAKVLYIKRSGNGVTIVVDVRTKAAERIEHRMSGYETKKKQKSILPSLYNKLKLAAEIVATSDSGLRDSWTTLRHRDKNKYPFSILSWKTQTSDALRMYVSHIAVNKVNDEAVREILEENGVTHLLMFLGACDKNNQEELLPLFTGRTRRIEAADGAGV